MTLALVRDPGFPALKSFIIETTGLAFYNGRDDELAGHVGKRMATIAAADCDAYLRALRVRDEELDALVAELTIGETYFFRYSEQFTALREVVLPDLLQRNREHRRLRIWSAGCATGPEPYSISILLRRELAAALQSWEVTILGTDINREFLSRARRASFPEWAFRGVSPALRQACFTPDGESWSLAPEYRHGVHFQYHNLVRHPFPSLADGLGMFDLILCRNVFIYFATPTLRRMLDQFRHCLVDGGWLLVGHAESNVELFRDFRTVSVPGAVLYQKVTPDEQDTPYAFDAALSRFPWTEPAVAEPPTRPEATETVDLPLALVTVRTRMDEGQWRAAEQAVRQLLAVQPLDPMVHFHLALVQEHQGQTAAAERSLRQALYLDRRCVLAHYHLGVLQQRQGDRPGALRSFETTLRLLHSSPRQEVVYAPEGLTVGNLVELASMHVELLS